MREIFLYENEISKRKDIIKHKEIASIIVVLLVLIFPN